MQAQLKTAQANTRPKFLIELAKPPQEKIVFKKLPTLKKNKTPDTQARQKSTQQMTEADGIKMIVTHDRQERQPITAVLLNAGIRGLQKVHGHLENRDSIDTFG